MADEKVNITQALKDLQSIVNWFEEQDEVDVEAGLEKVKEAAKLIKSSKSRLAAIENEFKEIEMEIAEENPSVNASTQTEPDFDNEPASRVRKPDVAVNDVGDEPINLDDIPF